MILKRKTFNGKRTKIEYHFLVVNSDAKTNYPLNFVCLLPKHQKYVREYTEFSRIFEQRSEDLAKKLLSDALKREANPFIRKEIQKRLSILRTPVLE